MAGLGWQELLIVLAIVMVIFGAGKLPTALRSMGVGVKEFKSAAQGDAIPASSASGTASDETANGTRVNLPVA